MAAPKDYLSHLPWKVLKIVISNLPDLASIFRLLEASENAKNAILSHVPNLAQLIENNINRPVAEGGLHPENKILLQLFALISWRHISGPHLHNLLPVNYHDVIPALANTFSMTALSFPLLKIHTLPHGIVLPPSLFITRFHPCHLPNSVIVFSGSTCLARLLP
jgi:hypothetical protein